MAKALDRGGLADPVIGDLVGTLGPVRVRARRRLPARWVPAALTSPALGLLGVFVVLPAIVVFPLALFEWNLVSGVPRFVGLANVRAALAHGELLRALQNTVLYCLLSVPASVAGGLAAAVAIESLARGRTWWRIIYFLPVATTQVAMAVVWRWMFYPRTGLVDQTVGGWLGLTDWLNSFTLALPALAVVGVWTQVGFCTVVFLAGLAGVPQQLHEAAALDGARRWARFRHVTWPALGPATVFATVASIISALRVYDPVRAITDGGPVGHTETLSYLLWRRGVYSFDVGGAAVVAVVLLALTLAVTALHLHGFGRRLEEAGAR